MKFLYHRLLIFQWTCEGIYLLSIKMTYIYIYIYYLIIETRKRIYKNLYMIVVVMFIFINIQYSETFKCLLYSRVDRKLNNQTKELFNVHLREISFALLHLVIICISKGF